MGMGNVIDLQHARASISEGHKSGRNSERETPVSRSIGKTNSAGTPFFDRLSQYQTSDCLVPMSSASLSWLPARSHARLSASTDMSVPYPNLGSGQPKNMLRTRNPNFGKLWGMKPDPVEFGRRVRERRDEMRWSQTRLAKEAGMSDTNIGVIERGEMKDPRKQALILAEALLVTPDWLLTGRGQKELIPGVMTREQLQEEYVHLPADIQFEIRKWMTGFIKKYQEDKGEEKA